MTTGPDRGPRTQMIWVVSACRFAEAISIGMLIPVIPGFIQDLTTPALDAWLGRAALTGEELTAIVFSLTGFAMAGVQLVAGRLSDASDRRKPFILGGMLGGVACTLAFLFVTRFHELLLARTLQGIFLGLTFPPMMAIIAYHAPSGRGGRVLGLYSTFRLVGFGLGPLIGGWVTAEWGRTVMFELSAGLLALSIFMIAIWVPDFRDRKKPPASEKTPEGKDLAASTAPVTPRARLTRVNPIFYLHGAVVFLMMVGISAIMSFFPYYQERFGATERDLGLVYSVFVITRCLFQFPFGWLGDRFDKKNVLVIAMLLFIPLVGLMGFVTSLGQLMELRLALGAVTAGITSAIAGMSAERSEPGNRARVMGINTMSFSLGVAVGPLGGFLGRWSYATPFVAAAVGAAVVLVLVWLLLPSDREFQRASTVPVAVGS